jgi:D-arabinose 1-dehydrogenase-like Zn-dependent alcohol dehydrogenase
MSWCPSIDPSASNFNPDRKADPMLQGKTIIVTGAACGIGAATAALVSSHGAEVISVTINRPATPVRRFVQADLSDRSSIERLVAALPSGAHGLPTSLVCRLHDQPKLSGAWGRIWACRRPTIAMRSGR